MRKPKYILMRKILRSLVAKTRDRRDRTSFSKGKAEKVASHLLVIQNLNRSFLSKPHSTFHVILRRQEQEIFLHSQDFFCGKKKTMEQSHEQMLSSFGRRRCCSKLERSGVQNVF